jgi:hypothetical protein
MECIDKFILHTAEVFFWNPFSIQLDIIRDAGDMVLL